MIQRWYGTGLKGDRLTDAPRINKKYTAISRFARSRNQFTEYEIKFQKVEILAAILNHLGKELEPDYFSSGSTVTRLGLQSICGAICGDQYHEGMSKKVCIETILKFFGDELTEGDFITLGSTVTRKSLMRIYRLLLDS